MITVTSVREVLKEGKIVKISARTGDHQDRYLFLVRFWILKFSNILFRSGRENFFLKEEYMAHTLKILIFLYLSLIYMNLFKLKEPKVCM
jgi:hypothetical protein